MKSGQIQLALALAFFSATSAKATFQNLNFEAATVVPTNVSVGFVPIEVALPGWSVYYGNVSQSQISYNNFIGGGPGVFLFANQVRLIPLTGDFGAYLFSAFFDPEAPVEPFRVSIGQTGQIPLDTRSIVFKTTIASDIGQLSVEFQGERQPVQLVGSGPGYFLLGADFSAYAGQTGEFRISGVPIFQRGFNVFLDDIEFSTVAVPEPGTWALLGLGALTITALRRRWN